GLSRWENGNFSTLTTADGLSDNSVTALYEDAQQTLWIGTSTGGLNCYAADAPPLAPPDGERAGMRRRFRAYTSRQGLFSDEIFEILEDDQGWLWMSCSQGVFRVRKRELTELDAGQRQTLSSLAYGKTDGMESSQCNGAGKPAGWKSRDGRLWFATSKGLVAVDPKSTKVNHLPPPVYIERVLADRKELPLSPGAFSPFPRSDLFRISDFGFRISVPPGRGELEFHYTALHLQAPEASRFKYQLEGVDVDWVEAGMRRQAYYNHLAPGRYRFRVLACNKDGVWNEQGAALDLELEPHWWQTWWWRGVLACLVIGGASGTARYLTRKRLQRKLELLERRHAIEQERGRIAKDIHDDLGSSLTRIMMLGERAEEGLAQPEEVGRHVRKIVTTARQTVQTMDEIVWAVNPENDTLEGLVQYISHYADEFFENTAVSCRLEMPVELPALMLPAEVRHDLFLVVKEAFHNVLKHAHASAVQVQVAVTGTTVEIRIEDNGCGFEVQQKPTTTSRKGNGLGNMGKRLAALGGQLDIFSAPGAGTRLKLRVELAPNRKLG
ncbi:MAG TPA: triple tyrosine motif-containing protein, partial [Bacillota bacterium]|nr:triple tyrosine motif-containing protein [Bacillota bacterium]